MELLKSFTENINIEFHDDTHTYFYKGKQLFSASTFVKDFEESFDKEGMSSLSSQRWEIDQDDILALWDSNGKAASGFGTAIHAVLEHYYKHKKLGAQIQKVAGKDKNAAMPNHPFLQSLINELDTIRLDGESYQEVCVSAHKKGICGQIDDLLIVDKKKKICRIRDYKITYDISVEKKPLKAPFAFLGGSKLSKNFLQLSFYGYLMQNAGWTVEGIDIFNWDGSWHKHTLEGKTLMKTMVLVGTHYLK